MDQRSEKPEEGKLLPVMEEFYSLQGEGFHTGRPAWFIRIGGCDVGCRWCDAKDSWNASLFPPLPADEVAERAARCPAQAVVITGGEPMLYDLTYLTSKLKALNITTFLETSGSQPITGDWDWVCLSPKKGSPPLKEALLRANELKIIIFEPSDFEWAEQNARETGPGCMLFLQPEWSRSAGMMPEIVDYIKHHPKWRMSLQSHKYMHIP